MRRIRSMLLLLSFIIVININAQQRFRVGVIVEAEAFTNYGEIDTYEKITDGYSPNGNFKSVGLEFKYRTFGITLKKLNLELKSVGFENPYNILKSQYDDFPRMWSGKGGGYTDRGYLFEGYSVGLLKIFELKHFNVIVNGEYGVTNRIVNGPTPNTLFSYSYNTEEDFTSRHWGVYEGGKFYSFNIEIERNIYKGLYLYCGIGHRYGSFEYVFSESVRDDLVEENNLQSVQNLNKTFNSVGLKLGLKYIFEI